MKISKQSLHKIRRDYGTQALIEANLPDQPLDLFDHWFQQALVSEGLDANAMVLSTADADGIPDARIVLLKDIMEAQFVFYTHYDSAKAKQMAQNPHVALTFYWPHLARQVRIRGIAHQISDLTSAAYFYSRPLRAQLGAVFSPQSQVIPTRESLESQVDQWITAHPDQLPDKPIYWGGYGVRPERIEFWQGRDNRLHDRIQYYQTEDQWKYQRLAP